VTGKDLSSQIVSRNIIYLIDAAALGILGNRIFYQFFIRDKKNQIKLQEANNKLQELDKAKTRIFSNVTHEFRTPLVAVSSTLQTLLDQGLPNPEQMRSLESGKISLEDMLDNVNDFLLKARSDQGLVDIKWSEIEIVSFLERALLPFKTGGKKTGNKIIFTNNLPPSQDGEGTSLNLYADRMKLKKIINNLVGNAMKFTVNGTVEVVLDTQGEYCIIQVKDSGKGIPKEDMPTIFDPFTQASNNPLREVQGSGLGLAMVRDFVKLHKGEVSADSEVGKGSTFTVKLLLGDAHVDQSKLDTSEIFEDEEDQKRVNLKIKDFSEIDFTRFEKRDPQKQNILITEDTPNIMEALATILKDHYNLYFAKDGREGLEKVRAIKPDLVITDIMMPHMNGYEFIEAVKSDKELRVIPMVAVTSKSDTESKVKGYEVGADEYIPKPFNNREIVTRIKRILKEKATTEELLQTRKHASVGVLAGGMAHELNNPVAAIRGYIQDILESLPKDSPLRKSAEGAERATGRCKRIVADLLTFSHKSDTDKGCHLNEVVEDTVAIAKKENDHPHIDWKTDISANNIPPLSIDAAELKQVLMTLINNAKDAMTEKGTISIQTKKTGEEALIEVSDTGHGIPLEIQDKIFDPFFTTKPPGKGMGLGLALAYNTIKRYGGDIAVKSQPGQGSRFIITLPVKQQLFEEI